MANNFTYTIFYLHHIFSSAFMVQQVDIYLYNIARVHKPVICDGKE